MNCLMKKPVEIKLRYKQIKGQDEWGNPIESVNFKGIIAIKKSVTRNEFYKAATLGLRPSVVFEIYKEEYNNADGVIYNDTEYTIIRDYDISMDKVELICERKISDVN